MMFINTVVVSSVVFIFGECKNITSMHRYDLLFSSQNSQIVTKTNKKTSIIRKHQKKNL